MPTSGQLAQIHPEKFFQANFFVGILEGIVNFS
jgi:hypothetical protein